MHMPISCRGDAVGNVARSGSMSPLLIPKNCSTHALSTGGIGVMLRDSASSQDASAAIHAISGTHCLVVPRDIRQTLSSCPTAIHAISGRHCLIVPLSCPTSPRLKLIPANGKRAAFLEGVGKTSGALDIATLTLTWRLLLRHHRSSALASPGPAKCCKRSSSPLCHAVI